jgi:signal transduction histidine kinase
MKSAKHRTSLLCRYSLALLTPVLAALLILPFRTAFHRGIMAPYLAAVIVSAWHGGLGPGLVATGLSMALSAYLFLEPTYSLAVHSSDDIAQLIVFSIVATFVSIVNTAQKRSHAALQAGQERMKALNDELETRVQERTAWLRLVFEVTRSANQSQTISQAIGAAVSLIGEGGGWDYIHAYISSPQRPEEFVLSPVFYRSPALDVLGLEPFRPEIVIHRGGGVAGRVAATGEAESVSDLRREPAALSDAQISGLQSEIAFPVNAEGQVVAVIECFRSHPAENNEQLLNVFRTLGAELGLVVERKRLQEGYAEAVWNQQRVIAQELHDGLGQVLAGTGFLSQALSNKLTDPLLAGLSHRVTDGIERSIDQIRGLAKGVFPLELESGGLKSALEELAHSVEAVYSIRCRLECKGLIVLEDPQKAIQLYRMAQESVTNAVKHARAKEVRIRVWEEDHGQLCLSISDDGVGIPESSSLKPGSGLRSLRYRAASMGASLRVESAFGKGTRVTCQLSREERKDLQTTMRS